MLSVGSSSLINDISYTEQLDLMLHFVRIVNFSSRFKGVLLCLSRKLIHQYVSQVSVW